MGMGSTGQALGVFSPPSLTPSHLIFLLFAHKLSLLASPKTGPGMVCDVSTIKYRFRSRLLLTAIVFHPLEGMDPQMVFQ